jgi:4-diphosphocytidyl-2-C-methyl-D-erythritol kinase
VHSVAAPAKVNLTLEILARRADGYHALRSVMVPVALCDALAFAPAERFAFSCEPPSLAEGNLVLRALARIERDDAMLAVHLRKHIPVGAGLGGGSSDAAAVLRAAMEGAFGAMPARDWLADARALGSDVPFFLADAPALVEGTGERVTALGAAPPWWVVLAVPPVHVSTADAYAKLAAERAAAAAPRRARSTSASVSCGAALQRGDYAGVVAAMCNDFEALIAGAYPAVRDTLDALTAAGADRPLLSGSGGACFTLAPDEHRAHDVAARISGTTAAVHVVPFAAGVSWR